MIDIEQSLLAQGRVYCGIDEAGAGPLCGDVLAAAVVLDPAKPIPGLDDSKKLTEKRREALYELIMESAVDFAIARATVAEIDDINILNARLLAMSRAVAGLSGDVEYALVDGNRLPKLDIAATAVIKGDSLVQSIAAASVLAKVSRDREMVALDRVYPGYGFAKHKGYGTQAHLQALQELGPCAIHRRSYAPVKALLGC
ncbi:MULTISPECIES: ribonuclease HII [unclassified Oceanobacter]|jgi:ribonuclease HII|uniref:ribonuclease HII n=2 Tax=Gammaproteobacteria TaxID=1236 RepID=UPI0026E3EBF1|nr:MULTISPECIES: ribonuclease HII [unclassified Oceanobacter]MDO6682809.1 ribonuclease HII [Oceanobacter sp. 5_MG-2023]MDP2504881.1 ribonuclease HII [Oceanobacter sp. 3_MG-2023]MDP2546325.1 ribonuclease HII [Oceanobacter sp. 4_MG-2023]MDP2607626.1 ribonuclease HII [Oceanobacter sp. 1_MG-2023]MDP2610894.1 ribonuclease HII [Oceanobacter sp. 2_MG-2023]